MKTVVKVSNFYLLALVIASAGLTPNFVYGQKEAIGYNALVAEVGGTLETGAGVVVEQVEASEVAATHPDFPRYLANAAHAQNSGKTIIDETGLSTATSGHATGTVGIFMYGNTSSISPDVNEIHGYFVSDWIDRILGFSGNMDPIAQNFKVSNHSWVGRGSVSVSDAEDIMRRVDFYVNQNEMTVAVGADNGATRPLPRLLAQGYNVISVGLTSGSHSHGLTTIYGAGRIKPDILAPVGTTSRATGLVSSAASLLHEKAVNMSSVNAAKPETIKAILMAGATKEEFPTWDRTPMRPLDDQFGAGELNIYNSYFIMDAGETDGSLVDPVVDAGLMGWDYEEALLADQSLFYDIEVGRFGIEDLSILLTWNMQVTDTDDTGTFSPVTDLADLTLTLYDSTNGFLDAELDISMSSVDNVEHIYVNGILAPGTYTIEVRNDSSLTTDFALAWRATSVPEPSTGLLIGLIVGIPICTRRRVRRNSC